MKIECSKEEWSILEPFFFTEYISSTQYDFPNFKCDVLLKAEKGKLLEIEGKFNDMSERYGNHNQKL